LSDVIHHPFTYATEIRREGIKICDEVGDIMQRDKRKTNR